MLIRIIKVVFSIVMLDNLYIKWMGDYIVYKCALIIIMVIRRVENVNKYVQIINLEMIEIIYV